MKEIKDFINSIKGFYKIKIYTPIIFTIVFLLQIIEVINEDLDQLYKVAIIVFNLILIASTLLIYIIGQKSRIEINKLSVSLNRNEGFDNESESLISKEETCIFIKEHKKFSNAISYFVICIFLMLLISSLRYLTQISGVLIVIIQGFLIITNISLFIISVIKFKIIFEQLKKILVKFD
jgi:cell division protein FtsL